MKLIGSRRRERVGKAGLIEDEQRMVRAFSACGSSAEKARMQVFSSQMPVLCRRPADWPSTSATARCCAEAGQLTHPAPARAITGFGHDQ